MTKLTLEQINDFTYDYGKHELNSQGIDTSPNTTYSTPLIALFKKDVFPVFVQIGPQGGVYFLINDKKVPISYVYKKYRKKVGGYEILYVDGEIISILKSKATKDIESAKRSITKNKEFLTLLETLQTDYPEYFL